jgi:hypothetical protein
VLPKPPAADCFHTFAVTALRPLSRQTSPTLSARRDRGRQDSISDLVTGKPSPELFNTPTGSCPDHESWFHLHISSASNMKIGSAEGR